MGEIHNPQHDGRKNNDAANDHGLAESTADLRAAFDKFKEELRKQSPADIEDLLTRLGKAYEEREAAKQTANSSELQDQLALLQDEDPLVRERAAESLGTLKNPAAVSALVHTLNDPDPNVRAAAAWALGKIKDPLATSALSNKLTDPDREVQRRIADALGEIQDPAALSELTRSLKLVDWPERARVVAAIAKIGGQDALKAVVEHRRTESNAFVRDAIHEALKKLAEQ